MAEEIESKIRIVDHEPVRAKLRLAGADYIGRVLEMNHLYDDSSQTLFQHGCGLRIRECKPLDGECPAATITFKGPMHQGPFKQRREIEVEISDARAMIDLLHALGYSEQIVFEKKRESWRADPCKIELDEVPNLGLFVEVEGPDAQTIQDTLNRLGLDPAASIRKSYVAMLMERASTHGPREFRFAM